jgi:hypothetical protein
MMVVVMMMMKIDASPPMISAAVMMVPFLRVQIFWFSGGFVSRFSDPSSQGDYI